MKKAVLGSLILAILHSVLFYGKDLGVSVLLFAVVCVFLIIAFLKKHDRIKNKNATYLSIPILLLSSTYFIFNNEFFSILNFVVIPLLLGIMIVWATADIVFFRELIGKSINLVIGSLEFLPNSIKVITDAFKSKSEDKQTKHKKAKLIGLGILCSIPLLLIILALLMSADGVFAQIFSNVFEKIEYIFSGEFIGNLIGRIIVAILVFVYIVCIVYNIFSKTSAFNKEYKEKEFIKFHIDSTIINTVLTIINVVYLIFTGVQILYLVANESLNESLNLAQYARQGFFQLMFITIINFAIILLTNANEKKEEQKNNYTKWMNVLMCIFTIVIAVSAFARMHLYESEYGYTFLRLMVYFILATEIVAILPTIYYIFRQKLNLLKSYLIIGIVAYIIMNFANIDYMIAKNNVDRVRNNESQREIDIDYLVDNLGTDAVSEMVYLYETTENENDKRKINNYLYNMYKDVKEDRSIQEWNISKDRAKKALEGLNLEYKRKANPNSKYYNDYQSI